MSLRFACCALGLLVPAIAGAFPYTWPGAAPCNATLQVCIDAVANGATVQVATNTAIDEDISLYDRSLTLTAASGYAPAFGSGHWLSVTSSSIAGDLNVSVSGLAFHDGYVYANYNGTGTATYDFERLTLTRTLGAATYIGIIAQAGTINATLVDNRVNSVPTNINDGLIRLAAGGATLNVNAYYNHVTSSTPASSVLGGGIVADMVGGASGTLKLHGNEVRGGFNRGAIFVSEGLFSSTPSNFSARLYNNVVIGSGDGGGTCIGFVVNTGNISAQTVNNTATRCYYGVLDSVWDGGGGGGITNLIQNNVLVANVGIDHGLASVPSNDYNLINAGANFGVTLGAHTITAPAQLVVDTAPRLQATSPAIDAADGTTLALGLIVNTLPTSDADNTRRFKGAAADIGAYEYGDASFTHTADGANTAGYITYLDDASLNANNVAKLIATPNYNIGLPGGVAFNVAFGAYYSSPSWALFSEDATTSVAAGAHFDVFAPSAGGGSFAHVTSGTNVSTYATTLDDSSVNNLPDRIVLVTSNWSAGAGIYNAHPLGVFYGSDHRWHIANLDHAAMPINTGFNVYAQEPGPNAFAVTADSGNSNGTSQVRLDHPLLNGTPCARPQVTRVMGDFTNTADNFDVYYNPPYWTIFGYGSNIALGDRFHVVVDAQQVFDCTDRIFADDFETR